MVQSSVPASDASLSELEREIDAVRENIRELIEQAAGFSGAADDEQAATRLAEQEARLARLIQEREAKRGQGT